MRLEKPTLNRGRPLDNKAQYNDTVVRQFTIMVVVWGVVGMLVGVIIAAQLIWPQLNFDLSFLSYSRLRPLHTNAVIFAFGGSALFGTSYYVMQRTCHVRLAFDKLENNKRYSLISADVVDGQDIGVRQRGQ